jgi:hypothetical protein
MCHLVSTIKPNKEICWVNIYVSDLKLFICMNKRKCFPSDITFPMNKSNVMEKDSDNGEKNAKDEKCWERTVYIKYCGK